MGTYVTTNHLLEKAVLGSSNRPFHALGLDPTVGEVISVCKFAFVDSNPFFLG